MYGVVSFTNSYPLLLEKSTIIRFLAGGSCLSPHSFLLSQRSSDMHSCVGLPARPTVERTLYWGTKETVLAAQLRAPPCLLLVLEPIPWTRGTECHILGRQFAGALRLRVTFTKVFAPSASRQERTVLHPATHAYPPRPSLPTSLSPAFPWLLSQGGRLFCLNKDLSSP